MARSDPKLYQDKMKDTLNPFNGDNSKGAMGRSQRDGRDAPFLLTVFECTGQDQFDGGGHADRICSEDEGDQVGQILTCCTADDPATFAARQHGYRVHWPHRRRRYDDPAQFTTPSGPGHLGGYGNGARRQDGAVL